MVNVVMPMAGRGSRFVKAGYEQPKFLIEINGKSLLQYSLESVPLEIVDKVYFIALNEHLDSFKVQSLIERILPTLNFEIVGLDEVTQGQAQTVLTLKDEINNLDDLIIYNIDTYFQSKRLGEFLADTDKKKDGILGAFRATEDKWSFAEVDANGFVSRTTEKEAISDIALSGFYHFTRGADFVEVAEEHVKNKSKFAGEYYVAPMYNDLIKRGNQYLVDFCDEFVALGTPEDLINYQKYLNESNNS
jgi:dTDP-glucose pyrophosphorylase